jgi:CDP-glucose 4,6-dehydratase
MSIWLKELGADVYGYALPPNSPHDNYALCQLGKRFSHLDADIRDKEKLTDYFKKIKPDIAFHLAAQPLVIESYKNTHYNFETNIMGTVNFFEAVRNCESIKAAVNITTDKCYRNNEWIWGYRENEAMGGDDPYSASKGCSELITHSYHRSFFYNENSCNIASARAGNVIGGGDWADNRIFPDIMRGYKNSSITMIRNPQSVRPWQHVLEPISGYLKLGEKLFNDGKTYTGGWNFGPATYENYSVGDVAKEIMRQLPEVKIEICEEAAKVHEAGILKLDVTKAVNNLKWKPRLNFTDTIRFTIEGYLKEFKPSVPLYEERVRQINEYCLALKNLNCLVNKT